LHYNPNTLGVVSSRARLSSQTVLLISYHFYPTNEIGGRRTTALARHLAARGLRVIVVSAFGHQEIRPGTEIMPGVIAIPVKQPRRLLLDSLVSLKQGTAAPSEGAPQPAAKAHATSRPAGIMSRPKAFARRLFFRMVFFIDAYKRWAWRASRAAIAAGRRYDARAIVSSSPPKTLLLAGALAAKRLGVPHIADFRDPWTDSLRTDPQHRAEYLLQRPLERWVVQSAACVTSAGTTVAGSLATRYPAAQQRIHVVRNGYDGEPLPASSETGGRLALLFAGDLYLGRDPFPLLRALEELLRRPDVDGSRVSLTLMGRVGSYGDQSLSEWLDGRSCASSVRLLPHLPSQAVAEEVSRATVLVNLAQQQPYSVPAKTYEHLISSRENLLVCENDCETALLVKGIRGVNQVDSRDPSALERTLYDLYRRHAIEGRMTIPAAEQVRKFSREAPNEQFWRLIGLVAGLSTEPPSTANHSLRAS
jgi:hypothetical protein